ncbi:signal peptidase I [bacterium]|nr:signal peptidase I [candidate division CSSED10-310 bacterium]
MKNESIREMKTIARVLAYAAILLYFFSGYVLTSYRIEGNSMNPLLSQGERVLSDRLVYKSEPVKRGDVVVFRSPSEPRKELIKRVIGLPGEILEIRSGTIYINREPFDEPHVPDAYRTTEDLESITIPLGHYFVAGDHRNVSSDSRVWAVTTGEWPFIPERYIKGRIVFRIWPLNRISRIRSSSV